uniref:Uncharacterized protein n=1 Tax=Amphimedon queenslandica TaxID=400682 RepID=A0A1X7V2X1_AMPQE
MILLIQRQLSFHTALTAAKAKYTDINELTTLFFFGGCVSSESFCGRNQEKRRTKPLLPLYFLSNCQLY